MVERKLLLLQLIAGFCIAQSDTTICPDVKVFLAQSEYAREVLSDAQLSELPNKTMITQRSVLPGRPCPQIISTNCSVDGQPIESYTQRLDVGDIHSNHNDTCFRRIHDSADVTGCVYCYSVYADGCVVEHAFYNIMGNETRPTRHNSMDCSDGVVDPGMMDVNDNTTESDGGVTESSPLSTAEIAAVVVVVVIVIIAIVVVVVLIMVCYRRRKKIEIHTDDKDGNGGCLHSLCDKLTSKTGNSQEESWQLPSQNSPSSSSPQPPAPGSSEEPSESTSTTIGGDVMVTGHGVRQRIRNRDRRGNEPNVDMAPSATKKEEVHRGHKPSNDSGLFQAMAPESRPSEADKTPHGVQEKCSDDSAHVHVFTKGPENPSNAAHRYVGLPPVLPRSPNFTAYCLPTGPYRNCGTNEDGEDPSVDTETEDSKNSSRNFISPNPTSTSDRECSEIESNPKPFLLSPGGQSTSIAGDTVTRQPHPTRQPPLKNSTQQPLVKDPTRQPSLKDPTQQPLMKDPTRQPSLRNLIVKWMNDKQVSTCSKILFENSFQVTGQPPSKSKFCPLFKMVTKYSNEPPSGSSCTVNKIALVSPLKNDLLVKWMYDQQPCRLMSKYSLQPVKMECYKYASQVTGQPPSKSSVYKMVTKDSPPSGSCYSLDKVVYQLVTSDHNQPPSGYKFTSCQVSKYSGCCTHSKGPVFRSRNQLPSNWKNPPLHWVDDGMMCHIHLVISCGVQQVADDSVLVSMVCTVYFGSVELLLLLVPALLSFFFNNMMCILASFWCIMVTILFAFGASLTVL